MPVIAVQVKPVQIIPVYGDRAFFRFQKPGNQLNQSGLSRTAVSGQGHLFSGRYGQRHLFKDRHAMVGKNSLPDAYVPMEFRQLLPFKQPGFFR